MLEINASLWPPCRGYKRKPIYGETPIDGSFPVGRSLIVGLVVFGYRKPGRPWTLFLSGDRTDQTGGGADYPHLSNDKGEQIREAQRPGDWQRSGGWHCRPHTLQNAINRLLTEKEALLFYGLMSYGRVWKT